MSGEVRCRCCGIGIGIGGAIRRQVRVCIGCDGCDELHGAKLQGVLAKGVADGKLAPYTALARMLIDDAQLTGRTEYVITDGAVGDLLIPHPPPRWLVVAARSLARNEQPDLQSLVDAVLQRYIPGSPTPDALGEMRRELRDALQFIDPSIMDVEVSTTKDVLDPMHLKIEITAKTPTIGNSMPGVPDVDIPADILSRPRAEA